MEPTVTLFVGKGSQQVEFIVMVTDGFIMRALPGVHLGSDVGVEYWTTCTSADLGPFLTANYEVSRYLWDSAGEGTAAGPEFDFEDGLAWEVPPVQSWAKGEPIPQAQVLQISEYLGDGDEFTVGDIAMEFPEFDGPIQEPVEMVRRFEVRNCLWCGIEANRAYNFTAPDFDRYSELRYSLTDAVLWTDGVWYDQFSDGDFAEDTPQQFGDSLLTCKACSAVFLASELEAASSESGGISGSYQPFISPGSVAKGQFQKEVSDAKIVHAGLGETLDYLAKLQREISSIGWAEWVGVQQLVGLATHEARCGRELSTQQDKLGRELLKVFCGRIGQILEGTLGAMYSGPERMNIHLEPNYFLHDYPHEEEIPLANVYRIIGDFDRASRLGGGFYDSFEEIERSDSHEEVTLYTEQRRWLLRMLISREDTRWAAASNQVV